MMLTYNIFQLLCLTLGFPFWIYLLLKKQKYRHKLCERLGFSFPTHNLSKCNKSKKRIIIHGVSVGEVNAALPIIQHLLSKKGYQPVLTTTTHTGYHSATKEPTPYPVFYFPLDFLFSVKRFLNKTRPVPFLYRHLRYSLLFHFRHLQVLLHLQEEPSACRNQDW